MILFELPKLEILPRWHIQGPTSNTLLSLFIESCDNFRALWEEESPSLSSSVFPEEIDHLIALRKLKIKYCPQLSTLPEKMGNLSALTHLTIKGCPELVNRCKRGTDENWNKIAHVPDLYISDSSDSGNIKRYHYIFPE